jgi:putative tryptophan/tyrosine transport system substrate-binding protein
MVALGDPLGTGIVDSMSKPSGNITGMSLMVPDLAVKRLELLQEVVPSIARVLILSYLADPIAPLQVNAMEQAASSMGILLQVHDIRTADDIQAAFEAGVRDGANGVLVTGESMFIVHRARVAELAARHRLPAILSFQATSRRCRRPHVLRRQGARPASTSGCLCGLNSQGRQTVRASHTSGY